MSAIRKILLDTNILIKVFDTPSEKQTDEIKELRQQIFTWLKDENVLLCITPLIRFEVLNRPSNSKIEILKNALDLLRTEEIDNKVAERAADLLQKVMVEKKRRVEANKEIYSPEQERITKLKLRFDVFHVATEIRHQLELESKDTDIKFIQEVHKNTTSTS